MTTLNAVINYFAIDPLKVLYVLGGTGGVWFWVEKWIERIRVQIRPLSHTFDVAPDTKVHVQLQFEAVNIGKSPTSLESHVFCSGYSPQRELMSSLLEISEPDRILPPHSTRTFTASGDIDALYPFWLFKAYRISPTRGVACTIYTRSNPRKPINWLQFDLELTLYRMFGWLPFLRTSESDD